MDRPPSIEIDIRGIATGPSKVAEEVAYRVLPLLMDVAIERVDVPGGPPGRHDFELVTGERRIAVEVTACVDPEAASFADALDEHALHRSVPDVSRSWEVRLHENARLAGLIEDVGPLLADLDELRVTGLARLGEYDQEPLIRLDQDAVTSDVREAVSALFDLGVDTAWSHLAHEGSQVVEFIRRSSGGSARTEDRVTTVVNQAALAKAEVLSRPAATDLDERHLFVWIDSDLCDDVEFSLWTGYPPAAPPPHLPDAIDHVWVAAWSLTPGEGVGHLVIWEALRGGPWRYPEAVAER